MHHATSHAGLLVEPLDHPPAPAIATLPAPRRDLWVLLGRGPEEAYAPFRPWAIVPADLAGLLLWITTVAVATGLMTAAVRATTDLDIAASFGRGLAFVVAIGTLTGVANNWFTVRQVKKRAAELRTDSSRTTTPSALPAPR